MHFAVQTIVLPISRKAIQPEATIVGQPILAAAGFQPAAAVSKTRSRREKAA
jgi:hypothetical protein